MLSCIAATTTASAQPTAYEDIQIQIGLEKFVLTPTPVLTVHGIGAGSLNSGSPDPALGDTFYFGERELPALEPMLPQEANDAWRAISKGGVPHAAAFTYFLNCSSNPELPLSLAPICQVPLMERGQLFNIKANEVGREVGTHLEGPAYDRRPPAAPVGRDGSVTVRKDGRTFWEGQLPDGLVAVLCDRRNPPSDYECSHSRALTPTTYYRVTFLLDAKDPSPSDTDWRSFASAVAEIMRGLPTPPVRHPQ